jgi:two-component system chemotaxis response regulator CheY
MKVLIVEDDFMSRKLMMACLGKHGVCDIAVNGVEAVTAFDRALFENEPYDLITLDIMMPEMNGQEVLQRIRQKEEDFQIHHDNTVKVIMTTALKDSASVMNAFKSQCDAYLVKPIDISALQNKLNVLGLVP